MATTTINSWMTQEKASFENFNEFIAIRLQDGIFRSLAEKMKLDLAKKGSTSVTLPWGTFSAEVKVAGEGGNITPSFEPSKAFMRMLTDDSDSAISRNQDTFDPDYVKLLKDYVAYGTFDPDSGAPAREKGIRMSDDEVDYFLNSYCHMLVQIARDKQRDGKTFRLNIEEGFNHGVFEFEYVDDDNIKVKFVADKAFKMYLKDDEAASKAVKAAE